MCMDDKIVAIAGEDEVLNVLNNSSKWLIVDDITTVKMGDTEMGIKLHHSNSILKWPSHKFYNPLKKCGELLALRYMFSHWEYRVNTRWITQLPIIFSINVFQSKFSTAKNATIW